MRILGKDQARLGERKAVSGRGREANDVPNINPFCGGQVA